MLTLDDMYPYQRQARDHIIGRNGSMLWLDMGLGKTVITLSALEHLLDSYKIRAALILAPLKVVEAVWQQEAEGWEHTRRLKFSVIRGTATQRLAALREPADIYLTNYEMLQWLIGKKEMKKDKNKPPREWKVKRPEGVLSKFWIKKNRPLPFDAVVFDEISRVKTSTGKRSKAFQRILPQMTYRIGLTGTPASNGIQDLHGQYLMIDGGRRLGPNITGFRNRWMIQNTYNHTWAPRRGAMEEVRDLVSDITLEMAKEDYLQLAPLVNRDIKIDLPDDVQEQYKQFENEFFMELDDQEIEAFNAGAKSVKCRQLANGACYIDEQRENWITLHDEKLDHTEEILTELNGRPLLLFYQFKHDLARLCERFPMAEILDRRNTAAKVKKWNESKIPLLICHPQTAGHGLNLQYGGNHILWFSLPWSLEQYEQAVHRLLRNGQKGESVINHRLITRNTVEEAMVSALARKGAGQERLRQAVKEYQQLRGILDAA